MGLRDSLEGKAKKWALGKAHDLLGDKDAPAPAEAAAAPLVDQQAVADAQAQAGEKVVRSMFPGLSKWADDQQHQVGQRQAAEAAQRRAAIAALPKGDVKIQLSGALDAHWWGQLPAKVTIEPGTTQPEEWRAKDPFVGAQTLVLELTPQDDQRPPLAGRPMALWRVSVPNFDGDGTYDLVALMKQRQAAQFEASYDECWLDLDGDDGAGDYSFYFHTDAGAASVTVADDGRRITASVAMGGAVGNIVGTVEVALLD